VPSNYQMAMERANIELAGVFGEEFAFFPMVRPSNVNKRPGPDPDRLTIDALCAVFDLPSESSKADMRGEKYSTADYNQRNPELHINVCDVPQGVKELDRFTRASTGETYEVTSVKPDGLGVVHVCLVQRGLDTLS